MEVRPYFGWLTNLRGMKGNHECHSFTDKARIPLIGNFKKYIKKGHVKRRSHCVDAHFK